MRTAFFIVCALVAPAAVAETCVENAGAGELFFAVETPSARAAGWLPPGGTLCAQGNGRATVSAFVGEDVFEGCSRRVPEGVTEILETYLGVDNCIWERRSP